jgi:hypothetical protein
MKKLLMRFLFGTPIVLIGVVTPLYGLNIPQPAGANELYHNQSLYPHPVVGDRLIGGGYIFPQGGRDLWMRVHVASIAIDRPLPGSLLACSPDNLKKIQSWFLEQATAPKKMFSVIPLSDASQVDEMILKDLDNIRCGDGGVNPFPENKFGEPPRDCSISWVLYHSPSRFYYRRFSCQH